MAKASELPCLKVTVCGRELSALVDSGSAATLVSATVWDRKLNRPALEAGGGIQLRSVDGGLLNNLGRVRVAVKVGHATIEQEAHVIGKLPYDLLLGIDFIRSSRMVLNAAEGYVQVGGRCLPLTSSCRMYNGPRMVSLSKPVKVPAGHVSSVAVSTDTLSDAGVVRMVEFSPVHPEDTPFPQLEVPELTAETNASGQILVPVCNPSEVDVTLPAGYVLGQTTLFEGLVASVPVTAPSPENEERTGKWTGRWPSRQAFLSQFPPEHLRMSSRRAMPSRRQ